MSTGGPDWSAANSLVLIEGSTMLHLVAGGSARDFKTPRWDVLRNPDDADALSMDPFPAQKLSLANAQGLEVDMLTDAVGSFSVLCFDDKDGDGKYTEGEPACYFNVVVARVIPFGNLNQSGASNAAASHKYTYKPNSSGVDVDYSDATTNSLTLLAGGNNNQPTVGLKGTIGVIGGGSNGLLGVERVHSGWCQNMTGFRSFGTYSDQTIIPAYFNVANAVVVNYIVNSTIPATAPMTPALSLSAPMLDTGYRVAGEGGIKICLITSSEGDRTNQGLGQTWDTRAQDTPGSTFVTDHPRTGSKLNKIDFAESFIAFLVVWTDMGKGLADPGANLYSAVMSVNWELQQNYTVTYNGQVPVLTPAADNHNKVFPTQAQGKAVPLQGLAEVSGPTPVRRASNRNARAPQ